VEGVSRNLRCQANDPVRNVVNPVQIACGNSYNRDAAFLKPGIALKIALRTRAHIVTDPVDLDCKLRLGAIEIEYVRSNRMLPAKCRSLGRTRAQLHP
jgi:hypothetical protein